MKLKVHVASRDSGIILILTLFTLFIVIALITQLSLGSEVLYQSSRNYSVKMQMRLAGESASQELFTLIRDDASGEASSGLSAALSGGQFALPGMEGAGFDMSGGAGLEEPEIGESEPEEDDDSQVDSFEDAWAKPMRIQMGEYQITTFVDDENGKFHLGQLCVSNIEEQEAAIERAERIIDLLREDFDDDISESDARVIVGNIMDWLNPEFRDIDWPAAPRLNTDEVEDTFLLLNTLEELMLIEGIGADLFYDQVREGSMIAPGLESVFTIYTLPQFEEPGFQDNNADSVSSDDTNAIGDAIAPPMQGEEGEVESSNPQLSGMPPLEGEGGLAGVLETDPIVGLKININTAPRAVMQGLFPTYRLSRSQSESVIEWRNEVDEDALERQQDEIVEQEDAELRESIFGLDQEEPKKIFRELTDLEQIPGFESDNVDPETQLEIDSLLGVQSEVFSVYVYVHANSYGEFEPDDYYQEPPGISLKMRAIVWRCMVEGEAKLVYLRNWHAVPNTRWRIPDYQRDLPSFRPQRYE